MKGLLLLLSLAFHPLFTATAEELLHSKFNDTLVSNQGKSWQGTDVTFAKGVEGKALDLKGGRYISFSDDLRFSSNEGTLEMWLKTNWSGNDGKDHMLLAFGKTSGIRITKSSTNELMFIWAPGGEQSQFGMKFSVANDWPAHEWRHLTFTWNRGSFFAYIDGVARTGGPAEQTPSPLTDTKPLFLGGFEPFPGDFMVDDLILRNNELTRAEIVQQYVRGMELLEQRGDPRLVMRALIGKTPATLILDTGSALNVLFRPFAIEAGAKLMPSYRGGDVFNEETNTSLTLPEGKSFKMRFIVLKNEAGFEQHGLLGWAQFFSANRLRIQWDYRTMKPLTQEETKTMTSGWQEHDFSTTSHKLRLPAVPLQIGSLSVTLPLIIDTGDGTGLSVTKKTWDALLPKLDQNRRGLSASWTPNQGRQTHVSVVPESIGLFGATMKNISISQDRHQRDNSENQEEEVRMGLAALSYFDVVIDGLSQKLWLRPRAKPAIHEDINLSGLLFVERANGNPKTVTLRVLEHSTAWNLGLRSDDEIIEIDDEKPAPNEIDPDYQIDVKRRLSHGQSIRLKVRRGEKIFDVRQETGSLLKP